MLMRFGIIALGFSLLLAAVAADRSRATPQDPPAKPTYQPTGGEGIIAGTVRFEGKPTQPRLIDASADPACPSDDLYTEDVIVRAGKLANAFVYVRSGD